MAKKLLVLLVLAAAGVAGFMAWNRPEAIVAEVKRGRALRAVPASVTVMPEKAPPIISEVGGRILLENFNLDPGAPVKAGEIVAQLDTASLRLEIERTVGDLEVTKSRQRIGIPRERERETAAEVLANLRREAQSGNASESDVRRQERIVQGLQQQIDLEREAEKQLILAYENTLKVKNRQLEAMTVRSPINGQISQVFVTAGQFIGDRSELATVITNTRTIEARVSEENFADIRIGQSAIVTFLTYGDRRFNATVSKILPTADSATQRYVIHLDMPDTPIELLKPGITGEASILTGARDNALVIPRRAMIGDSVFVVNDGQVELRRIKQGFVSLSDIEVLEGLAEGDQVIVEELDTFREGDRVKPVLVP